MDCFGVAPVVAAHTSSYVGLTTWPCEYPTQVWDDSGNSLVGELQAPEAASGEHPDRQTHPSTGSATMWAIQRVLGCFFGQALELVVIHFLSRRQSVPGSLFHMSVLKKFIATSPRRLPLALAGAKRAPRSPSQSTTFSDLFIVPLTSTRV